MSPNRSSTAVSIRPYHPADVPQMLKVIQRAFAPQIGLVEPAPSATRKTLPILQKELEVAGAFVAHCGGQLMGCVLFEPQDGGIYFGRLAVLPAYQRRGVAKQLIAKVEETAVSQRAPFLTLAVRVALTHQQAFYKRLGFQAVGFGTHEGFNAPTFIKMRKQL